MNILNHLAEPNTIYLLMMLGFYALLYEVTHPGFGVPGILGIIFLVLSFSSLQAMPVNYVGLALIILGIILFVVEALLPGLGFFAIGGLATMVYGSIILFDSGRMPTGVSLSLILTLTATTAAITIFLLRAVMRVHRSKVKTGERGMIGEQGETKQDLLPGKVGKVFVHGEIWNAISDEIIKKSERIVVEKIKGLQLKVRKE